MRNRKGYLHVEPLPPPPPAHLVVDGCARQHRRALVDVPGRGGPVLRVQLVRKVVLAAIVCAQAERKAVDLRDPAVRKL